MNEEEFFEKVSNHSKLCKGLSEGDGGFNIMRGMAKVSSGYIEDLFALFLAQRIGRKDLNYLVDKTTSIRFSPKGKATCFKPDLSVIDESDVLREYFDLKTNLGWNRDLRDYLKKKNEFINKIRGRNAWIHFSKENVRYIQISQSLKYKMVVIFGGNISENLLKQNIALMDEFENIELFILFDHYQNRIHTEDFERLITTLNIEESRIVDESQIESIELF